jgi:FkbM family methyltransferase
MRAIVKRLLIRLLEKRGYCVSFGEPATFDGIISLFNSRTENFFFVQIGAYDGRECDPIQRFIRRYRWSGILVEPQPDVFEKLRRNYANVPGLVFERTAIADQECSLPLYKLKEEFAHLFHADHKTLCSFIPEHITKHLSHPVDLRDALEKVDTPCSTISGLIEKHHVTKIDLLQIDAEGYDFIIVKSIDFSKVSPLIIHFEHAHLPPTDKAECIQLLISRNYKIVVGAYDMTAFQSNWMYE